MRDIVRRKRASQMIVTEIHPIAEPRGIINRLGVSIGQQKRYIRSLALRRKPALEMFWFPAPVVRSAEYRFVAPRTGRNSAWRPSDSVACKARRFPDSHRIARSVCALASLHTTASEQWLWITRAGN